MLPLSIQTSHSNMVPIRDFKYLCELARCSKCQSFVLFNGTLYGFKDDCSSVHEINVPFQTNTDLVFRFDTVDKNVLPMYNEYFIPAKHDWVILPDYYWDMYIGGDIIERYDSDIDQIVLLDKNTMMSIPQFFIGKTRIQNDFMRLNMMKQLEGFFMRQNTLSHGMEVFMNMESNPVVREIFDGKVKGSKLLHLKNRNVNVAMMIYKSLFTLNKSDELSIAIRPDMFIADVFMATFIPMRKKNPMKLNTYNIPFSEKIHAMYVNLV